MCLISICPVGTEKFNKEVEEFIRSGASCNRQGSGFMYKKHNDASVYIKKGYFDIDLLIKDLKDLNLGVDDELVIHHRTATSGLVTGENTHPFIISNSEDETIFKGTKVTNKPAMVHNGMFWDIKEYMALNTDLSDTYAFATHLMPYLIDLFEKEPVLFQKLTNDIIGTDKVCILYPEINKPLAKMGRFIEKEGYYHSNMGYCSNYFDRGGVANFTRAIGTNLIGEGFNIPNLVRTKKDFIPVGPKNKVKHIAGAPDILVSRLDRTVINITKSNYKDFHYRKKADVLTKNPNNIIWYTMSDFDELCDLQILTGYDSNSVKQISLAIPLSEIHRDYLFTPVKPLIQYYECFLQIVSKKPMYSKNALKDLEKLLSKNFSKKDDEFIRYKAINNQEYKKSLMIYKNYLELCRDAISKAKKDFEPVLQALN